MEELWSLDKDQFEHLKPVYGLVFLFKWVADDNPSGSVVKDSRADGMFFAKQVINNACATQAILSVLLNSEDDKLTLGSTLGEFKEFVGSFDSQMKGLALSNSEAIRSVHNSFSRQNLFEFDQKMATKDDDVFHFVSYVPIQGRLYELDGLKEGPIDHGAVGDDWLDLARPIIEQRMAKYQAGEIHFNLMALVRDKLERFQELAKTLSDAGDSNGLAEVQLQISDEQERRARWARENIRRRHNYLPFIMELLKGLAAENKLMGVYEKAKEKSVERDQAKKKRKEEAAAK